MKELPVAFTPEARDDLFVIYSQIAENADPVTAMRYVERIEAFCAGLSVGSECGTLRDDVCEGLRVIGLKTPLEAFAQQLGVALEN